MNRAWMISWLLLEKNIVGDNKTDARKDIQKAIVYLGTGQKVPKDLEERIDGGLGNIVYNIKKIS